MRRISRLSALAAFAALGLMLVPMQAFPRGGSGVGGIGRGTGAGGHRTGIVTPMHRAAWSRASLRGDRRRLYGYRYGRGLWGWGGVSFWGDAAFEGPPIGPEPGSLAGQGDVPLVDFYNNIGIYTGGPYGFPLGYAGFPAAGPRYGYGDRLSAPGDGPPARGGCTMQNQVVPNSRDQASRVTVVRC